LLLTPGEGRKQTFTDIRWEFLHFEGAAFSFLGLSRNGFFIFKVCAPAYKRVFLFFFFGELFFDRWLLRAPSPKRSRN
jgi:hypothetical protein